MADTPAFTPRKKNALDSHRLRLSAKYKPDSKQWSTLNFGFRDNQVTFTVWTNDPDDVAVEKNKKGLIQVSLPPQFFAAWLVLLGQAIAAKEVWKNKVDSREFTFMGGQRSETPQMVGEVWVGKDADGIVWMSVHQYKRPNIKFNFGQTVYNQFWHADGQPLTDGEASVLVARGFLNLLNQLAPLATFNLYEEPKPRDPNKGQNRGNSNGGQQRSGGGQSRPAPESASEYDDDIPF